jgi:nicotinate-nucleotide adenylyltransferase
VHSASVAQYAGKLASLYEVDIWKAIAAGLLHDMAKEFPLEEQKDLARQYLDDETLFLTLSDDLMHGPAAAKFISKTCGKCEVEFLDAIAFHSTGRGDMSVLGQILFLADKIAFDRTFRRLDAIRSLAEDGNLDDAMKLCLEEIFTALKYSGVEVNSLSLNAYRKYAGGASS